jgi:hypothetical protein
MYLVENAPQWSPPLNGGNTGYITYHHADCMTPQWSPPLNGGSTTQWKGAAGAPT